VGGNIDRTLSTYPTSLAKFINAMPPKVRDILDQPNFTVQDLIGALGNFHDLRDKDRLETSGVYIMLYSNFKEDRAGLDRRPEQYVGKTVYFKYRANREVESSAFYGIRINASTKSQMCSSSSYVSMYAHAHAHAHTYYSKVTACSLS
jgi:hypothetical protein